MAREIIGQVNEIQPNKAKVLRRVIRRGQYRLDPEKISAMALGIHEPEMDLELVDLMSRHPALIPEYVSLYGRNTTRDLLRVLQFRDGFTGQHSFRVAAIAMGFGRHLQLPRTNLEWLKTVGYFHDIGKARIARGILLKPGALLEVEQSIIKKHPLTSLEMVQFLHLAPEEQEIILHHHEHWDGRGYPEGLMGEKIPFLCRLVALADAFEALTHDRPHRPRFPISQALGIIEARAGTQFDPYLTAEFTEMDWFQKTGLPLMFN
jgi:putative nucleotidyltransferase with HDIG domain